MNIDERPTRTAIIHDWFVAWRGGEKIVKLIWNVYRPADLFTLIYHKNFIQPHFPGARIQASLIQQWPLLRRKFRWLLPFFPRWVESWDLEPYDLVLSSSHCVAKGVIPRPDALHVSYIHTPMRYVWDQRRLYFGYGLKGRWLDRWFLHNLRQWDTLSSSRVDLFVANSRFVARRIEKYYRRRAVVIPPPIDTRFFTPAPVKPEHFLVVSALVPYKRIDVVIDSFAFRPDLKLIIVGEGPLAKRLRCKAPPNVTFYARLDDTQLRDLYRRAYALIHPAVEDFGMNVAESLACGRPAIVNHQGGAAEIVEPEASGKILPVLSRETLLEAIESVLSTPFDVDLIRKRAENFAIERFTKQYRHVVQWAWETYRRGGNIDEGVRVLGCISNISE